MIVFQVEGDPDYIGINYDSVEQVTPLRRLEFNHVPLDPAHVVNIQYAFKEPEEEGVITDCPYSGLGSTLVLSRRASDALGPMLNQAGALLRLTPPQEMGYRIFVCYQHIDALDTARTEHQDKFEDYITRFEFHPAALEGVDIFRLSNRVGRLFVSDRFVSEVRRRRLSGFRFRRLWLSDRGGVPLEDPVMIYERFPPGYGTTLREKRDAMRRLMADWR